MRTGDHGACTASVRKLGNHRSRDDEAFTAQVCTVFFTVVWILYHGATACHCQKQNNLMSGAGRSLVSHLSLVRGSNDHVLEFAGLMLQSCTAVQLQYIRTYKSLLRFCLFANSTCHLLASISISPKRTVNRDANVYCSTWGRPHHHLPNSYHRSSCIQKGAECGSHRFHSPPGARTEVVPGGLNLLAWLCPIYKSDSKVE